MVKWVVVKWVVVKWVVVNRGDEQNPEIRAHLVECEYKFMDPLMEGVFAAMPPFEGLRMVIRFTMTAELLTIDGVRRMKKAIDLVEKWVDKNSI